MTPSIASIRFTTRRATRTVALLLALLTLVLSAATPTQAATTVHDTVTLPFDVVLVNACTGEDIAFSGHVITTSVTTIDSTDGFHAHVTSTPHHVRGTGVHSGRTYAAVGTTLDTIQAPAHGAQFVSNFTSTYKLVSQGSSENLHIRMMGHVTITPNGDLTAVFSTLSLVCQG
jgi:hypothetical protein